MKAPDLLFALKPVTDTFCELGVDYYIGGSVASSAYGIARATLDVDLVVNLRRRNVRPFVNRLESTYYIDEKMILDAIERRSSFNLVHLETMIKIDVFIPTDRPYDREAFQQRREDTLDEEHKDTTFHLASPEDTILGKLEWFRKGGEVSERQWQDILGVMRVQGKLLDMNYLRHWAMALRVVDLLEQVAQEAGISD